MSRPDLRSLLLHLHDEQQARARLFLHLDAMTDLCDAQAFCDVLADVATLHAGQRHLTAGDRAVWQRLAEVAHACATPVAEPLSLRKLA